MQITRCSVYILYYIQGTTTTNCSEINALARGTTPICICARHNLITFAGRLCNGVYTSHSYIYIIYILRTFGRVCVRVCTKYYNILCIYKQYKRRHSGAAALSVGLCHNIMYTVREIIHILTDRRVLVVWFPDDRVTMIIYTYSYGGRW